MPISPYCFKLLYNSIDLAWAVNTLCVAWKYFLPSPTIAGGWAPAKYPKAQNTTVSLNVIQCLTLSPKALKHTSAYLTNASTVSLFVHPPFSSNTWGKSQWYKVTKGTIPYFKHSSITLL